MLISETDFECVN